MSTRFLFLKVLYFNYNDKVIIKYKLGGELWMIQF